MKYFLVKDCDDNCPVFLTEEQYDQFRMETNFCMYYNDPNPYCFNTEKDAEQFKEQFLDSNKWKVTVWHNVTNEYK
jgi:hypothetical protein